MSASPPRRWPPARPGAHRRQRCRCGLLTAADLGGRGLNSRALPYTVAASKAKYFASEASVRVANACVQIHGGYDYIDEFPVGKYLRDARVTTLYEGTSEIQKLLIGRALTGVSAF